MVGIACCCFTTKIKVSLFMNFNLSFGRRLEIHNRKYEVFIVYSHDSPDEDSFVLTEIMPLLEKNDLSVATEDSFTPGQDRFTSLQSVINESCTALIIITPDLLQEKWKMYQLNQVICMQFEQTNFKVVFFLCQEPKQLRNLPKNPKLFLRIGSTVKQYKNNWKGTLIYQLKHETKRSVNKRLTFSNGPLDNNNGQFVEMGALGPQNHLWRERQFF